MDLSGNNPEHIKQRFLRAIADEYGFSGDTLIAFLARFKPKNKTIINSKLANDIPWNRSEYIVNKEQKLEEELQNIYSALQTNCPNLGKRKPGRPRKKEEPWEIVYNWLLVEKHPEWLKTQNFVIPDQQEQKAIVCSFLQQIENEFQHIHLFHTQQPIILKDQYIPIQVTLERKYTHTIETTWSYAESEDEIKRVYSRQNLEASKPTQVDWKAAKKQHRCMMVLADPGMGKTTLLKREAYLIAQEERQSLEDNSKKIEDVIIPIFLRLSEIADLTKDAIAKLIEVIPKLLEAKYDKYFPEIKAVLEEKLKTGKCVLLFDALDEVPKEKHQRLSDKLNDFLNNYPSLIICTSRIVGYSGTFLANIKDVEIVPFTQKQTNEYIQIWFKNAADYINDESVSAASLIRELQNKPQIRGLAQNPLLLSLICSLYQEKGLTLPARRCEVYKQAVKFMLGKWRKARHQELDDSWVDAKIELLEKIAYEFSCNNQEIFTLRELRSKIDKFLKGDNVSSDFQNKNTSVLITELAEQDGILQKLHENGEQYLFLHRTFQEYLTACYLQSSTDGVELAKAHFWDFEWHEILSLMVGLMKNPLPLLETILGEKDDIFSTQLLLAGRCAAECQSISHPLIEEIINRIYDFWCRCKNPEFITSVVVMLGQTYAQMFEKLQTDLKHENWYMKSNATEALGKIGSDKAVDVLINALSDGDVKLDAVEALGKIGNDTVVEALIDALDDDDVKRSVVEALGNSNSDKAVDALIHTLYDENEDVKLSAAEALGKIGTDKSIDALIHALDDENKHIKLFAAKVLEKIRSRKATEYLIKALDDDNKYVKLLVAKALANIGNNKAIDDLIKALTDENRDVRLYAAEALKKIITDKNIDDLINALSDENQDVRICAAEALGNISIDKAVDPLINALSDENQEVKWNAIVALGKIGSEKSVDALIKALVNDDENIKCHVIEALGKIGSEKSVDPLINALSDDNIFIKSHAAKALGKIGSEKSVDPLINAFANTYQYLKLDVIEALGKIGSDKAVDTLIYALGDKNEDVKLNAIEALGNIGNLRTLALLIQKSDILNDSDIFLITRKLAIKFSKEKVPFIPIYPELLDKNFDL